MAAGPADSRFEYRAFAQCFGLVADRIRRSSECREITESEEIHLVAPGLDDRRVEVRRGRLEVESLEEKRDGLERWRPAMSEELPLSETFVRETLARRSACGREDRASPAWRWARRSTSSCEAPS